MQISHCSIVDFLFGNVSLDIITILSHNELLLSKHSISSLVIPYFMKDFLGHFEF